jgi:pimeloyl-ACP methyl ester carboxylesterase
LQGTASPAAQPHHTVVLLHGLLGSGRNWRMWARKLVDAAQAQSPTRLPLRMLLVDLRCHGGSTHLPRLAPPHTLAAAAQDVVRLIGQVVE